MTSTTYAWCGDCQASQAFERPVCDDGHDLDCPEWACIACGHARVELVTFERAAYAAVRAVA